MNIPKIRFKEFRNEWHSCKIDDFCKILMCKRIFANETSQDYEIPFYKIGTIGGTPDTFISKKLFDIYKIKYNYPKKGELLVTCSGTVGKCIIFDGKDSYYQDSNIVWLDNLTLKVSNRFLYYLLSRVDWSKLNSTTITRIYSNDLKQLKINYPEKEEQNKITNLLELLDKKIELQTKKIEALKLFKKGLFDIQLKINGKESIMFDDFLDEVTKKSSIQNQYPVLSSTSKGLFLQSDYFNKQASCENNVGYKILKRNQLVLSPQNLWMGNININNIFDIGIVSPSYRVYNIDIKKMDLNYFNYWIKTPKALYSYLISSEQGASIVRRNLNIEMFNQISLKIPNLEKQHIIGNRIYQFDLKINLEEEKLKLLYKLKKGLMQKMFI